MIQNKFYYQVVIEFSGEHLGQFEEKKMELYTDFESDGIEDFSISEKEVDEILGEKSLSGGEVSLEIIEEVEKAILKNREKLTFSYFFYGERARERANDLYFYVCSNFSNFTCILHEKNEEDWNEEWKKFYKPIEISERLRIVPSWYEGEKRKTDISIYPGFGFGTGDHPTTFLCLKLFDKIIEKDLSFKKSNKILDFGCGSGILGIAAVISEIKDVHFYDIDPNAIVNTIQNIELNGFSTSDFFLGAIEQKDQLFKFKYDFVFANILLETLKSEKETIDKLVKKDGILLLSGILVEQTQEIVQYYLKEDKYLVEDKEGLNGWCAIKLRRIK